MLTWPSFWGQHLPEGKGSQGRSLLPCRLLEYPLHPGNYMQNTIFKKNCINVLHVLNIDLQFVWSNVHQDLFSYHFSGLTPTTSLQNLIIPLSHAQALQMQLSGKNVKAEPSSPQDKGGSSEDEGPPEKQPRMSSDRWQYPLYVKIFDWKSCFMHKML